MKIIKIASTRSSRKKRVAAYCRVSTLMEEQEESLETQVNYYSNLIANHENWHFAGVYSDTKSGLNAEKREGFQQMINDALSGKIDYILVKSISRFSRNTVDCQKYVNLLHSNGVDVYFEKEDIDTSNASSTMLLSFMAAFSQNESRSISENLKWGIRERTKKGIYNLGNNRVLGYDSVNGKLVPNQDANIIRAIFKLYTQGVSVTEIQRILMNNGVRGRRGPLTANGISYILGNEVYVGDKLLQKRAPKDMLTKQPDKRIPFESNYVRGDHEGIISREMWNAAQHRLKRNPGLSNHTGVANSAPAGGSGSVLASGGAFGGAAGGSSGIPTWPESGCGSVGYGSVSVSSGGNKSPLFGKIICGECGSLMTRRTYNNKAEGNYRVWVCKEHINNNNNGSNTSSAGPSTHSGQCVSHQERLCHMRNIKDADLIAEIRK